MSINVLQPLIDLQGLQQQTNEEEQFYHQMKLCGFDLDWNSHKLKPNRELNSGDIIKAANLIAGKN